VFLERIMLQMGFSQLWVDMIMRCVRSVRFSVKVNGGLSDRFVPSRGLRQGDPLSPYLFLFCVEGFSALLRQAQAANEVTGVRFGANGPTVTHLLFADDSIVFLEASNGNLEALKGILTKYEECSGQKVNLQKSAIYFGKGCDETARNHLKEVVGIGCEALSERYLGLPTVVGRSRNGAFKYLTESSRGKVRGWKGQGMSKKGKEILVKSVLQAVPTYPMGCFQLTKGQCGQLSSVASRFWWGAADGQRKVHWIGWERMCKAKRSGGLGFRDYSDFNQALLAKQSWRLITRPNSLCARVLRARYYKEGDVLSASCPKRASFTWRSIMYGRDLLKSGIIWRIGDGSSVKIWQDNWIPRDSIQKPLGQKPDQVVVQVHELLSPGGGGWNEGKLRETFYDGDVDDILKIPVGRAGTEDYLAWNYTKNGIFSVKSAYHLKQRIKQQNTGKACSSNSCDEHQGWLALWGADVPGKVHVHCWRLAKNGLAVGEELRRRHIKEGVRCVACNREETILHRFWECAHSLRVWEVLREKTSFSLQAPAEVFRSHSAFQGWFLDWLGSLDGNELEVGMMALYYMWLARNEARDCPMIACPDSVATRVLALLEEWQASKDPLAPRTPSVVVRWRPPEEGWTKANADGAFSQAHGAGGGGVVLRDHRGVFLAGESLYLPRVSDPERAELLSCQRAVTLAKDMGVQKLILETDCLGAVTKLLSREMDRSGHGPLVEDIKVLLRGFADSSVKHVRRSGNETAHKLAKVGCVNKCFSSWVGLPPDFIVNSLDFDVRV
jgi:ribonuclease HI